MYPLSTRFRGKDIRKVVKKYSGDVSSLAVRLYHFQFKRLFDQIAHKHGNLNLLHKEDLFNNIIHSPIFWLKAMGHLKAPCNV